MREDGGERSARRLKLHRSEEAVAVPSHRPNEPDGMPVLELARIGAMACRGESPDILRAHVLDCRQRARRALDAELMQVLADTGFDAQDLCAPELTAQIADLGIYELLQTIANGRKDATIDLFQGSLVGRIWCAGGQVVDAVSGLLAGEPAVYRILALDQGELVVDFRPVRRRRAVASSTLTLMLEASRRKDESAVIERRLGGIQRAYRSVADARAAVEADSPEAALLAAFEAGARVETVLANGEIDDLSMLQAIASLVERGALVATDPPQALMLLKPSPGLPPVPAATLQTELSSPARRRSAGCWAAAVVGASVALAVLGLLLRANDTDVPVSAIAPSEPLEAAQASAAAAAVAYPVQVIVEPARAELWLDGTWMATGELSIVLGRTGQTHELRIAAPEYQPQTLLFRDTPPPLAVRLLPAN